MFDLSGKTALVTGSSRGIGRAVLLSLARQGAAVILHCRKSSPAALGVQEELRSMNAEFYAVYGDLAQPGGAEEIRRQVEALGLNVDILFLNASVELRRNWVEITDEEYDLQMNVNLRSSLKLLQAFVPGMQERRWGRVITMGSVQQRKPVEGMLIYSASKMALFNMCLSLAPVLAKDGVTINNIAPGAIHTDRNDGALSDPGYAHQVESLIPMGHLGKPEDIAGIAVYLASDESQYTTGQDIYVDGGKGL